MREFTPFCYPDFKFGDAKGGHEAEDDRFRFPNHPEQRERPAEEITSLEHLARHKTDGFRPSFLLDVKQGKVAAVAVSDAGPSASTASRSHFKLIPFFLLLRQASSPSPSCRRPSVYWTFEGRT
jgi:hypothetical protein